LGCIGGGDRRETGFLKEKAVLGGRRTDKSEEASNSIWGGNGALWKAREGRNHAAKKRRQVWERMGRKRNPPGGKETNLLAVNGGTQQ